MSQRLLGPGNMRASLPFLKAKVSCENLAYSGFPVKATKCPPTEVPRPLVDMISSVRGYSPVEHVCVCLTEGGDCVGTTGSLFSFLCQMGPVPG